ncbi:hypothetical protein DEJ47_35365 [Streptomyces venezuelae]|uniref:Uncharacterized protein n=1 Tax=Streptomyces venezuelae TaxID=54571 RepID=A0A5P2BMS5_STRVZ|nr:hypothetical protein DEJ47_35365 [Streptomyces venezuelae]
MDWSFLRRELPYESGTLGAAERRDLTRRTRSDELLDGLQVWIDAAQGTQGRVRSLREAVLSVGRELASAP